MDQPSLRSLSSAALAVGITGVVSISVPLMLISGLGKTHSPASSHRPAPTCNVRAAGCPATAVTFVQGP